MRGLEARFRCNRDLSEKRICTSCLRSGRSGGSGCKAFARRGKKLVSKEHDRPFDQHRHREGDRDRADIDQDGFQEDLVVTDNFGQILPTHFHHPDVSEVEGVTDLAQEAER